MNLMVGFSKAEIVSSTRVLRIIRAVPIEDASSMKRLTKVIKSRKSNLNIKVRNIMDARA